jgi:hypothetical protein
LSRIDLFPNPFEDMITIESSETIKKIVMSDALGRSMEEFKVDDSRAKLNTFNLPPGIYFAKIETESGYSLKKMDKQ